MVRTMISAALAATLLSAPVQARADLSIISGDGPAAARTPPAGSTPDRRTLETPART